MTAAGIGVDMLEISRMERVMRRRPNFLRRVFTEEERAYCERSARPAEHYAARWAAREAVVKALGCGFGGGVGIRDVSVTRDDRGSARARLTGGAAKVALEKGVVEVALSISYTRDVAVANAVAVTEAVKPKPDARADAARALAASFREAKSVLDELERVEDAQMALPIDTLAPDMTAVASTALPTNRPSTEE
ncbi:holo-ACP synthase [Paratractidigestivibacter sp.]|uniref:holo-ACP synthase n=1 Tax=Paratractidigestivibacter sp. TaxID=2847316 RepID=UPI002AC91116|nr:holo-ACP synthase [Paratractidigestivibacter sp.]